MTAIISEKWRCVVDDANMLYTSDLRFINQEWVFEASSFIFFCSDRPLPKTFGILFRKVQMIARRVLFAFGAGLAARTFILIIILVASFRTICPKSKVSIRYSTFEPAQPSNHLPVTVARRLAGHFSSAEGICVFTVFY